MDRVVSPSVRVVEGRQLRAQGTNPVVQTAPRGLITSRALALLAHHPGVKISTCGFWGTQTSDHSSAYAFLS